MGIVYRATDHVVGRDVAYKRLLVTSSTSRARATALFQREYNTLAQLAHPATVEVYDYGNDEAGPYYTMELLSGKDLLELAPMPVHDVCRVLRDIASALALIHARRLIHRDISPGNVRRTEDGRAKLLDFGALTPFGVPSDLVGTPAFMAPEMLSSEPLDQRADLYSLGALAYWALTRRPVYNVHGLDGLRAAWARPIAPPSMYAEMPKALEDLVMWLLHKDRTGRTANAAEVVERLTSIGELAPEPEEQKVAYSYLAHPPLVGREQIKLQLDSMLKRLMGGQGTVVLLEAKRGLGRSALLNHLTREGQLAGATVLRADASADTASFGLARTLTRLGLALHPELNDEAATRDTHFAQLVRSQRGVRNDAAWSPLEASQRQAQTLSLMETLLLEASDRNATVILIDELHRADAESLALIALLAEESTEHPLMLVVSASPEDSVSDAYTRIAEQAQRIVLRPLDEDETLELVTSVFGGVANSHRLARWLRDQSGGNPARTMDLTRLLLSRGLVRYTRGTFTLPHDISAETLDSQPHSTLLVQLLGLSPHARNIVSMLALSSLPLELSSLEDAFGIATREAVLAVEELRARELVQVNEQRVALTSAAIREAAVASLSDEEARSLHLKAGRSHLRKADGNSELRMQAGVHLLLAGEENEAAELLTQKSDGDWLAGNTPVPLLEAVLDVLRRQGRSDEQCLVALVPLVRGGFFGDLLAQRRHLDATLTALANVCGVTTAVKLTPRFGAKLALIFGVSWALLRHAFTPVKYRFGSFKETMGALLSILSATTAAAASAFDSDTSFRIARMFEPLRGFGPDSAPYLTIEFCLATAEVGAGQFGSAMARYAWLLERFKRPVQGMDPEVHLQFRQGILHGLAQAKSVDANPEALSLADELERKHAFFAPHAEVIRASYHGQRGEQEESNKHRKRGELLAMRGGISWSSVTVMTIRSLYMSIVTIDTVAVVQLIPELERLESIAPNMRLFKAVALAYLDLARGLPQRAVAAFEEIFRDPRAKLMPVHVADRVMHARALADSGRHQEALELCQSVYDSLPPDTTLSFVRASGLQLAELLLANGDAMKARVLLQQLLGRVSPLNNPCWTGAIHQGLARAALREGDHSAFAEHAGMMATLYRATRNPALIRQIDELQNEAEARLNTAPRAPRPSMVDDELDKLSTAFEADDERVAQLTGRRDLTDDGDTLPPQARAKQA
jgi:tetratricopeptide (TPR) repeat protein